MKSDSDFGKKSGFNPNHLLIDHMVIDYKYNSDIHQFNKNEKDENIKKLLDFISDKEKFKIEPYFNRKEVVDFLSSKLKAMEKMNLDDNCEEGDIETRKINIDKKFFAKSNHSSNKKGSISQKKKPNKRYKPKKNPREKNSNTIINTNGKIEKLNKKRIDLTDDINQEVNKELKEREFNQFFSDKTLLDSILNEMK